jgi:osmoprotectant transport system permease protein
MKRWHALFLFAVIGCSAPADPAAQERVLRIGSKNFTESVILAEMVSAVARQHHVRTECRHQLGGTTVLWKALRNGAIDLYPEYTGTLSQEVFAGRNLRTEEALEQALAELGIRMSRSLGFNDTYAIGMKDDQARRLGIRTLSDLGRHPELRLGFSSEFMNRGDGWPSLRAAYRLAHQSVKGLDHDLAYIALNNGQIDATDLYSTDAEIQYYGLRVLDDDLHHFPSYQAVLLYRDDWARSCPEGVKALSRLEGKISEADMVGMNARAKNKGGIVPPERVAADFLAEKLHVFVDVKEERVAEQILRHTQEHLTLVGISLAAAIGVALPLGIFAARFPRWGQVLLALAGVVQTIPSLALLVFLIPLLGLGGPPAIVALFLYSLLPIMRNTYTGLRDIPGPIRESAEALGLPAVARLWRVELPMASPTILAGIKTSAVINVGTATLGAIIGARGLGEPIMTGIRLDNLGLILQGAVPAAVLALLVQGVFELAERFVVPRGLRLQPQA